MLHIRRFTAGQRIQILLVLVLSLFSMDKALAALPAGVIEVPVSFVVANKNGSNVPCLADGKTYTVRGHLVGPASAINAAVPGAVTVYVHGIGWGEFYWHFSAIPEYDYAAQMAAQGHVSLTYDQIGYGASDRSPGLLNCYGSEATVAEAIVSSLRFGNYTATGRTQAPRFAKVALASNQAAALVAEPTAYSFRGVDALVVTSFSDFAGAFKPAFALQSAPFFSACALGGDKANGTSGPNFYVNFPPSDTGFAKVNFANADPAVVSLALSQRGRSPCGEALSAFQTIGLNNAQILLRQVKVPVLIVNGLEDGFFLQPLGGNFERALFPGSSDVSAEFIANASQALTLERSAPDFRQVMHTWLAARGF